MRLFLAHQGQSSLPWHWSFRHYSGGKHDFGTHFLAFRSFIIGGGNGRRGTLWTLTQDKCRNFCWKCSHIVPTAQLCSLPQYFEICHRRTPKLSYFDICHHRSWPEWLIIVITLQIRDRENPKLVPKSVVGLRGKSNIRESQGKYIRQ